jgi:hypothetical protein
MRGVKTKSLLAAALLFGGSFLMVFAAAKVETCDEKYKHCSEVCMNQKYANKAGARTPESYEASYKSCMSACDKAKADCEKANPPAKPAPKK